MCQCCFLDLRSHFILVRKICNANTTLHVYAAPTGSPSIQSFLITSDTTAELNWQPPSPLEQNGVIVDYSIELCSNHTGNCSRWNTGSNNTFYVLKGEDSIYIIRIPTEYCIGEVVKIVIE